MTEQEASQRWCPFARVQQTVAQRPTGGFDVIAVNRGGDGVASEVHCLGSRCMAWRMHGARHERDSHSNYDSIGVPTGYCGLAGKP